MGGEYTAQQAAALITVRISRGERLTNAQVADICGYMSRSSAYYLMMRLARVLPIYFDDTVTPGRWALMTADRVVG